MSWESPSPSVPVIERGTGLRHGQRVVDILGVVDILDVVGTLPCAVPISIANTYCDKAFATCHCAELCCFGQVCITAP